jgi:hypothetical protein
MEAGYKELWSDVCFLTPEEAEGRNRNGDLLDPQGSSYHLLADFGLGYKEGYKMYCAAQVMLDSPGFVKLESSRRYRSRCSVLNMWVSRESTSTSPTDPRSW